MLNCWVTETNDTLCLSNSSTSLAKSDNERVQAINHVDNDDVNLAGSYVFQELLQGWPVGISP